MRTGLQHRSTRPRRNGRNLRRTPIRRTRPAKTIRVPADGVARILTRLCNSPELRWVGYGFACPKVLSGSAAGFGPAPCDKLRLKGPQTHLRIRRLSSRLFRVTVL